MKKVDRRMAIFGALAALLSPVVFGVKGAEATIVVVYDEYGNKIVVETTALTGPVSYYTVTGVPYVVYPAVPAYAPAPVYGPFGVVGAARRVSRRTSRRVGRR